MIYIIVTISCILSYAIGIHVGQNYKHYTEE